MLLLGRGLNESVQIGNDIFVTVQRIKNNSVRLGFDAPQEVPIFRTEVLADGRTKPKISRDTLRSRVVSAVRNYVNAVRPTESEFLTLLHELEKELTEEMQP
jgi:carbon storage regulator